ncbi:MAG TPA: hypothetical protein VGF45_09270 [Polyangia bacterium]
MSVPRLLVLATIISGCATPDEAGLVDPLAPFFKGDERFVVRARAEGPVQVESLRVTRHGATITGSGSFDRPRAIQRASFGRVSSPPCSLEAHTKAFWLDADRRWDRPVGWSGTHRFELTLATPRDHFNEPAALDLVLLEGDREVCVRTRLSGSEPGSSLRRENPWGRGGGLGLAFAFGADPAGTTKRQTALQLSGSMAMWSGLWRGSLRGDFRIPVTQGPWWMSLPVTVQAERLISLNRRFTLALALGYQPGRVEDVARLFETHRTWTHGPRVGVMLLGGRDVADADPREGFVARGVGLFLMRQWNTVTGNPELPRAAWITGLEITAL